MAQRTRRSSTPCARWASFLCVAAVSHMPLFKHPIFNCGATDQEVIDSLRQVVFLSWCVAPFHTPFLRHLVVYCSATDQEVIESLPQTRFLIQITFIKHSINKFQKLSYQIPSKATREQVNCGATDQEAIDSLRQLAFLSWSCCSLSYASVQTSNLQLCRHRRRGHRLPAPDRLASWCSCTSFAAVAYASVETSAVKPRCKHMVRCP